MFAKLALAAAFVAPAFASINTPTSLIVCQPVQLSWTASTSPYYISIIPGGQAGATALEQLGSTTSTSETWTVDLAAGTNVTIELVDGTGATYYTSPVVIQSGTSTSCLSSSSSASSSASGTAASASGSSGAAAASGSASASKSASASSSASAAASSKASSAGKVANVGALTVAAAALVAAVAF